MSKVICKDNRDREQISDKLICENCSLTMAYRIANLLNDDTDEKGADYFVAVPDDYKLYTFNPKPMTTDTQLQLAITKMLTEKLLITQGNIAGMDYNVIDWIKEERRVQETEWEHIVRLVEETLTEDERDTFMRQIYIDLDVEGTGTGDTYPDYKLLHASWQQRAQAILKVKGAENPTPRTP